MGTIAGDALKQTSNCVGQLLLFLTRPANRQLCTAAALGPLRQALVPFLRSLAAAAGRLPKPGELPAIMQPMRLPACRALLTTCLRSQLAMLGFSARGAAAVREHAACIMSHSRLASGAFQVNA